MIFGTWHWSISGFLIGMVMLTLIYFGKSFGMSSNLRTLCSMTFAKKHSDFFDIDWKDFKWNLIVVFGAILGGFFAHFVLSDWSGVAISESTQEALKQMNMNSPNGQLLPKELFGISEFNLPNGIYLLFGGLLIGFGSRYAGGCTSGHAISGLSNFQLPSLIAVIGFFIGGLIMTFFILPLILNF